MTTPNFTTTTKALQRISEIFGQPVIPLCTPDKNGGCRSQGWSSRFSATGSDGENSHRGTGGFFGGGDTMDSQKAKVLETMAHHKVSSTYNDLIIYIKKGGREPYAVPLASKVLSKADYCRHFNDIRELLKGPLGLSNFERDVAFQLIRFGVYYGRVYPKASTLADQCQVSKRTVWRAIAKLRGLGVIKSYPVFINGYQTSSWYRLDKLFLMMAQFIAERGRELNRQAIAILRSFNNFWHQIWHAEVDLVDEQAPVKLKLPLTKG